MKHTIRNLLPAALLLGALLTSCAETGDERFVRVMLAENEHYTITGENPVVVPE